MGKIKYREICADLSAKIAKGIFDSDKIPSLKALAEEYGVSLMTARQAIKLLETEGLLICHPDSRGTVVRKSRSILARDGFCDVKGGNASTVTLAFSCADYSPDTKDFWDRTVEEFQLRYPWIRVAMESSGTGDSHAANIADVIQVDVNEALGGECRVRLADVSRYMKADPAFDKKRFLPQAWSAVSTESGVFGLPYAMAVPVMYVNRKAFPEGENIQGWDDLGQVCAGLRKKGYALANRLGWYTLIRQLSRTLAPSGRDWKAFLQAQTEFAKGSNEFDDRESDGFPYGMKCKKPMGLLLSYSFYLPRLAGRKDTGWRLMPVPSLPEGGRVYNVIATAMDARSRHPAESWLWIRHLSSLPVQQEMARRGQNLPVAAELWRDAASPLSPEIRRLKACFENADLLRIPYPFLRAITGLMQHSLWPSFRRGDISPERLLATVRERIQEFEPIFSVPSPDNAMLA